MWRQGLVLNHDCSYMQHFDMAWQNAQGLEGRESKGVDSS